MRFAVVAVLLQCAVEATPVMASRSCNNTSAALLGKLTGSIVATGGLPYQRGDNYFPHACAWEIKPDVPLSSIRFNVDSNFTRFEPSDYLDFYADYGMFVGRLTKAPTKPIELLNSNTAMLVLWSTSEKTRISLTFECETANESEIFGTYFTPMQIAFVLASAAFMFCCLCIGMRYRVNDHAGPSSDVRARAADEEAEKQVMAALEALPCRCGPETEGEGPENTCCLCLEQYTPTDELRVLPCSHHFHKDCVDAWFAARRYQPRSCPTCRRNPLEGMPTSASTNQSVMARALAMGTSRWSASSQPAAIGRQEQSHDEGVV